MQKRLRNYKHPLLSFEHNLYNLGMHNPGRYCGFDTMVPTVGLTFNVSHENSGIKYKDQLNDEKDKFGLVLTPQGQLIMEDAPIGPFTLDTNNGNGIERFDILVCEHHYVSNAGGQAATYSIIKGPIGSNIKPILADPLKQIVLGVFRLAPNAGDLNSVTYEKFKCPDSGDGEDARLNTPNIFKAIQLFNKSATTLQVPTLAPTLGPFTYNLWELPNDGNTFNILPDVNLAQNYTLDGIKIKDVPIQEGTRISIFINHKVTLRNAAPFLLLYAPQGYRRINMLDSLGNVVTGTFGLGVRPNNGEIWEMELIMYNDQWRLLKIGGAGNSTSAGFTRGMIITWYGDINNNFDDTGLGYNLMGGWQICNGNLLTPDMRGKIDIMASQTGRDLNALLIDGTEDNLYHNNPYVVGGNRKKILDIANMPKHYHNMFSGATDTGAGNFASRSHSTGGNLGYGINPTTGTPDTSRTNEVGDNQPFEFDVPFWASIKAMKL